MPDASSCSFNANKQRAAVAACTALRRCFCLRHCRLELPSHASSPHEQRDDAEAAKVYEEFVKEFAGDEAAAAAPRGGRGGRGGPPAAFVRGGTQRPGQPALAPSPGGPPSKARSGPYVPSFMPPGMAAAMEGGGAAGGSSGSAATPAAPAPPKPEEPVFKLPGSGAGRGKPRAIDALLENLKR